MSNQLQATPGGPRPELALLFEEVVTFYLRLRLAAAMIHRRGDLSGPRRTVLLAIARSGPQTVAHLARSRSEPRQRLQPLVNALIREGLVRRIENPLHKRSQLVTLTQKGMAVGRQIARKEGSLRARLKVDIPSRDIAAATTTLQRVRRILEDAETIRMLREKLQQH